VRPWYDISEGFGAVPCPASALPYQLIQLRCVRPKFNSLLLGTVYDSYIPLAGKLKNVRVWTGCCIEKTLCTFVWHPLHTIPCLPPSTFEVIIRGPISPIPCCLGLASPEVTPFLTDKSVCVNRLLTRCHYGPCCLYIYIKGSVTPTL
jgi:hypothetical protein